MISCKKILINWIPPLIWMGFIFFLSHQPNLSSGFSANWDYFLRKLAHVSEYGILTYLIIRALKIKLRLKFSLICTGVFTLIFAILDEYHQSFILGRCGCWQDVVIDSLGILLIMWIFIWYKFVFNRYFKKNAQTLLSKLKADYKLNKKTA